MYKGNKLAKEAEAMRQDYKTPQVIEDSLTNAQIRALEGMPAAMKTQYIGRATRTQVNQVLMP